MSRLTGKGRSETVSEAYRWSRSPTLGKITSVSADSFLSHYIKMHLFFGPASKGGNNESRRCNWQVSNR